MVRCGVFLLAGRFPGQDDTAALQRTVDAVLAAETAGFADAWIAEHHFMSYGVCPSALTLAAHLLGRARRITVGTAVSVLSTTHPVALAEQARLLQMVSDGRFHLGVGRGGPWVDLEVFDTGLDRYHPAGFADSLDLLLRSLRHDRVAGSGGRFRFREVPMVPRPRPDAAPLPVTVACTSPATVELAATRGLPMLLGLHVGDDDKAALVDSYREVAGAAASTGPSPDRPGPVADLDQVPHVAAVVAHVADTTQRAQAEIRTTLPGWLGPGLAGYVPLDGRPRPHRDPVAYTDLLCALHPVGSPQQCIDRLAATQARTGIDHVIMLVEGSGDHARTLDTIARLGAEVLPALTTT